MIGQEEVGPRLCLHLDECVDEIKDNLANKHMMKEMKTIESYTEIFRSLCSTLHTHKKKSFGYISYLLKLHVVPINYLHHCEIPYQTLIDIYFG